MTRRTILAMVSLAVAAIALGLMLWITRSGPEPWTESELENALPSVEETGEAVGVPTLRAAEEGSGAGGWDRQDIANVPDGCEDQFREVGDPDILFGSVLGDGDVTAALETTDDETFTSVSVQVRSGGSDLVSQFERLVAACPQFDVQGAPGATIEGARHQVMDSVAVEGDAFAFEQTFVYTDQTNTYKVQVWTRDGMTVVVTAFGGYDSAHRPTQISRQRWEALVHLVDKKIDDARD